MREKPRSGRVCWSSLWLSRTLESVWARAKGVEMLTVSVRDVSRREGRKVREAAQQGISVGSLEWLTCC